MIQLFENMCHWHDTMTNSALGKLRPQQSCGHTVDHCVIHHINLICLQKLGKKTLSLPLCPKSVQSWYCPYNALWEWQKCTPLFQHATFSPSWSQDTQALYCHVDAVIRNWIVSVPLRFCRIAGGFLVYYSANQSTQTLWYFHDTDFGRETVGYIILIYCPLGLPNCTARIRTAQRAAAIHSQGHCVSFKPQNLDSDKWGTSGRLRKYRLKRCPGDGRGEDDGEGEEGVKSWWDSLYVDFIRMTVRRIKAFSWSVPDKLGLCEGSSDNELRRKSHRRQSTWNIVRFSVDNPVSHR